MHTNARVSMTLLPAESGTGIIFRRTDLAPCVEVPATREHVVDARLCTTIGNEEGITVSTIEHLMAALYGCGVGNVIVELDGSEVPIMDGSSAPFVFLIECAGVIELDAPCRVIKVLKEVIVSKGDRWVSISPYDHFALECEISFQNTVIGTQRFDFDSRQSSFEKELSRARTFCLESDVKKMHAAGLALGGTLENAVVIGDDGILNHGGLRYDTEFARHKALDCIGDLSLAGAPFVAIVKSHCSGHAINHELLNALLDDDEAWEWTCMGDLDRISNQPSAEYNSVVAATA